MGLVKEVWKLDDSLDVFAVHGVGGILGTLLVAVFASEGLGGAGFGEGDWLWIIEAEEADPDLPIDDVDPDQGNDWELIVEFTVLVPRISEVGV